MKTLIKSMLDSGSLKFGKFILKSGKTSNYYVDVKLALTQPDFLKKVSKKIASLPLSYDKIGGLELGSVPLAVALSIEKQTPYIIIRKERKQYGAGGIIVGNLNDGERVLIVEDVITTGGTTIKGIKAIREANGVVNEVVVVVDREEGGKIALEKEGVKVISLLKARDLLEYR